MTRNYRIQIGTSMMLACILALVTGCHKSTETAATETGAAPPPNAAAAAMPEQAKAIAAQNAQGAEFDAKRRAAALAKMSPKTP